MEKSATRATAGRGRYGPGRSTTKLGDLALDVIDACGQCFDTSPQLVDLNAFGLDLIGLAAHEESTTPPGSDQTFLAQRSHCALDRPGRHAELFSEDADRLQLLTRFHVARVDGGTNPGRDLLKRLQRVIEVKRRGRHGTRVFALARRVQRPQCLDTVDTAATVGATANTGAPVDAGTPDRGDTSTHGRDDAG